MLASGKIFISLYNLNVIMNNFESAYKLTKDDLNCPKNCKICENGAVQFLPGEVEFLSKKFKIPKNKLANLHEIDGHKIWIIATNEKHCPFYRFGKCIKRDARPLDCRAYPIIPCLNNRKFSMRLDRKCPLVKDNKIKKEFIEKAKKAWEIINPPKWWVKIYEKEI